MKQHRPEEAADVHLAAQRAAFGGQPSQERQQGSAAQQPMGGAATAATHPGRSSQMSVPISVKRGLFYVLTRCP